MFTRTSILVLCGFVSGANARPALEEGRPPEAARVESPAESSTRATWEPADGRRIHFYGNPYPTGGDLATYRAALGADASPAGESMWLDIPGPRGVTRLLDDIERTLARIRADGSMLNLSIGFDDGTADGFGTARDEEYARTARFDAEVAAVARLIALSRIPTLLRIGCEVNGDWEGHHPYEFPRAFRKMVGQFRAAGADNVAFVFCVEPHGDADLFGTDRLGRSRWYPGDDVVDWLGIDLYQVETFVSGRKAEHRVRAGAGDSRGRRTAARRVRSSGPSQVTERLVAFARAKDKPVLIGECGPAPLVIPTQLEDPDGAIVAVAFAAWFEPFVAWLDEHPEVKAVTYCSNDFRSIPDFADWGDSRIENHPEATRRWREIVRDPKWINAGASLPR